MNALPPLSPEKRAAALEAARKARQTRSEAKNRLKGGKVSLPAFLAEAEADEVLRKMKVSALLESVPGIGKVKAGQIMDRIGIAETRRIGGLGANQRRLLEDEFAA